VNPVVARITMRGMLGRRRALLLVLLAAPLLVLAIVFRSLGFTHDDVPVTVLRLYGLGTLLPLVALIAGTGVFSPEIDDGTIVYLLSKPLGRPEIVHTKLAVAIGMTVLGTAVPMLVAALILVGPSGGLAVGMTVATVAGAIAYCAIFVLIGIATRHAVIAGLVYALIWESVIGQYVPGARLLSVQQWALSVGAAFTDGRLLHGDVSPAVALLLLVAVAVGATVLAGQRLRSLSLTGDT
jgi:ABC-2 type transport system permease protein